MSQDDDDLFDAGHIIGAFGVRGQVKVFSHTTPRENILNYSPWIVEIDGVRATLDVSGSRQGKNVIARIEGVTTRDQAEAMSSSKIFIRPEQLAPLAEGEYYWAQLEGLRVLNQHDEDFGVIDHMMETGANDVMVVQGERERLIPFVMHEVVTRVELDSGRVIVNWEADY